MAAIDGIKESVQNQTEFALRLTRQLLLEQAASSNAVFSPLSLQVVLSMLAAGTAGTEKERLLSFLKVPYTTNLHALASQIHAALFVNRITNSTGQRLTTANGVWIDKSLTFKPAFKALVDGVYQAGTNNLDFRNKVNFSYISRSCNIDRFCIAKFHIYKIYNSKFIRKLEYCLLITLDLFR